MLLRAIKLVSALGRHESKVLRLKLRVQSLTFKAEGLKMKRLSMRLKFKD